jgi:hypothetical protein
MDTHPMMKCGCAAAGVMRSKGGVTYDPPIPSCITHSCTELADTQPDLEGRIAQCAYSPSGHAPKPSSPELAFFEWRGAGSPNATTKCKCGMSIVAHEGGANYRKEFRCKAGGFTPIGDQHDQYYCGCMGWD